MNLIVAVDTKFGIAKKGELLCYLPNDLAFFKSHTQNKTLVIGRKTLDSFKNGNPLPNRHHLVLSRQAGREHDRITWVNSLSDLKDLLKDQNTEEVYVAGGGQIYTALLPYCQFAYVTRILEDMQADLHMPDLSKDPSWRLIEEGNIEFENGVYYQHTTWQNLEVHDLNT